MALAEKELYLRIGRPQNTCMGCGAPISMAGKHPSALLDPEGPDTAPKADVPLRQDYCATCWNQKTGSHYVGFWMARREEPKPRKLKTRKERNAALVSYFELLKGQPGEEAAQAVYVIAHLLMKYGAFKWVRSDADAIVFRNVLADELVNVEPVELEDSRIVEIKRELDAFLERAVASAEESAAPEA